MCFSKRQVFKACGQHSHITHKHCSGLKACITSIKRSTSSSSSCTPTACSPSQRLVGIKVFRILFTTDSLLSREYDLSGQTFPPHFPLSFTPVCSPPHTTASSFASPFSLYHLIFLSRVLSTCSSAAMSASSATSHRMLFSPSTSKTQNKVSVKKVSCF